MAYNYELDAAKARLQDKLKARYEPGPMRTRLYEVFEEAGQPVKEKKLAWMFYAGMGDVDLHDVPELEINAAETLLKDGIIVPTFDEDYYNVKKFVAFYTLMTLISVWMKTTELLFLNWSNGFLNPIDPIWLYVPMKNMMQP